MLSRFGFIYFLQVLIQVLAGTLAHVLLAEAFYMITSNFREDKKMQPYYVNKKWRNGIFVFSTNDYPSYYEKLHYMPVETDKHHLTFDSLFIVDLYSAG